MSGIVKYAGFAALSSLLCSPLLAYSGGTGTAVDPYKISTVVDWQELTITDSDWDKNFILTADLDFQGADVQPVAYNPGNDWDFVGIPFTGVLDGNGKVIRNVVINQPWATYVGLFGCISKPAQIRNLGVDHIEVSGKHIFGGLCGINGIWNVNLSGGDILSCFVVGTISGTGSYHVGGLCGANLGTIQDCYTQTMMFSSDTAYMGGLCGTNQGFLDRCHAESDISGERSMSLGGLCGNNNLGYIIECFAEGNVSGGDLSQQIGGLCGANDRGTITGCYATGDVIDGDGAVYLGGLCGANWSGDLFACFASGDIISGSGSHEIGGLCGINNEISSSIRNCYATGSVDCGIESYNLGGLCGANYIGVLENCLATGNVNQGTGMGARWGDYVGGLCGGNNGTIRACRAKGNVFGNSNVGGLVGMNDLTIQSCDASGNVRGYSAAAGGGVGMNYGTVTSSNATGQVGGHDFVGGLVGWNLGGTIKNSCANGLGQDDIWPATVEGNHYVGGLVGYSGGGIPGVPTLGGSITGCFAWRSIYVPLGLCNFEPPDLPTGGLAGTNWSTISDCYARGNINNGYDYDIGGLVGDNGGSISHCYAAVEFTEIEIVECIGECSDPDPISSCPVWFFFPRAAPLVGKGQASASFYDLSKPFGIPSAGTGLTQAQMMARDTFTAAGWDFVGETANGTADVWRMCGDGEGYPRLAWEFSQSGDIDCPDGVGLEDFLYFAKHWLADTPETVGAADLDTSGKVELADFALFAEQWMK
jgi:hypothetical protein